jgi:predicted Kef-type K+ transport protein
MGLGLLAIIAMARAAGGADMSSALLGVVLVVYGVGQRFSLPSLVSVVVGSSRIPAADAGSASGVFSMVQQVSMALGVTVVGGVFFGSLGADTSRAAYDTALVAALSCNFAMLAVTFVLAFWLPRRPR